MFEQAGAQLAFSSPICATGLAVMDQSYTACGEEVCIIWYGRRLNFRVQVQPLEPLTHFARDVMPGSFLNQSDLGSRRRFTGQGFPSVGAGD
ncbi:MULTISPECIES: hypothetical protein [Bradyrhizobium]|uniref:hypothetical protein n=1 Tax=Bradyrhizobium sp. USDA 241 TaxID=3377725 RepID=UPI003C7231BB